MSARLPVHVDPVSLADQGRALEGRIAVSALERLGASLHDSEGELEVSLRFGHDDRLRRCVQGAVEGEIHLQCQRCLRVYAMPLAVELSMVLVGDEAEADALPEEVDALVAGQRSIHTVDIFEDELILALPLVARCPGEAECRPGVELLESEALSEGDAGERQHPFAGLRDEH